MIYTSKFLKQLNKIKNKRSKEDTDDILNKIQSASNFVDLHNVLDIKKYQIDGTYRIRYSNNPEYRIRFDLVDRKDKGHAIELLLVMSREDYGLWDTRAIKESINESQTPKLRVIVTESQFSRLFLK